MKTIDQIREAVVNDLVDTCNADGFFLRCVVEEYVKRWTDEEVKKGYTDAYDLDPDEEDE